MVFGEFGKPVSCQRGRILSQAVQNGGEVPAGSVVALDASEFRKKPFGRRFGWYDSEKADNRCEALEVVAVDGEEAEEDDNDFILGMLFSGYEELACGVEVPVLSAQGLLHYLLKRICSRVEVEIHAMSGQICSLPVVLRLRQPLSRR